MKLATFRAGMRWRPGGAACDLTKAVNVVIPGLVPGIQLSANAGASGTMDPGAKRRDDRMEKY